MEQYRAHGDAAFTETAKNRSYSNELKVAAVKDYLSGNGSIRKITAKYSISSSRVLRYWIVEVTGKVQVEGGRAGTAGVGGSAEAAAGQAEIQPRLEELAAETERLEAELSNLKGVFSGKRRREIETRLLEIAEKEQKLRGGKLQ